jgi:predicted outer membrane protein
MRIVLTLAVVFAGVVLFPWSGAAAPNRSEAALCGLDRVWLTKDVQGSRFELAGVNIALARSVTPAVLQLAETVRRDDAAALTESSDLMRRLDLKAPATMDPVRHWSLHMVAQESGAAFDRDYAWLEVANQVAALRDATDELRQGCSGVVRGIARNRLPYLRLHLRLASTWQTGPKS